MKSPLKWMLCLGMATLAGRAQDITKLPDWAAQAVRTASADSEPADVDSWVLLDRTEIAYAGEGEIRKHCLRVVKVLTERGTYQGVYSLHGLGGKASKVKKLKGWNLRPDSALVKLDSDNVLSMNDAGDEAYSIRTATAAVLERVVKGSIIAFESLESISLPIGPLAEASLMENVPVRIWELDVAKKEGWFTNLQAVDVKVERRSFEPWITKVEALGTSGLRASNVPALPRDEGGHPNLDGILPAVEVRFLDPKLPVASMWGRWDGVGQWFHAQYANVCQPSTQAPQEGKQGLEALKALWAWMGRSLTYKAVYLTPERGWIPESSVEVGRKRYGDCKDLASFFMSEAKGLGFKAVPVLAKIVDAPIEGDRSPFNVFNHAIAALRLERTLGLPGEVETPKGRFLIVDPTDPYVPFGRLGSGHQGRRVMICLPEGAQWVTIPDAAIQKDALSVVMDGQVEGSSLKATVRFAEDGDYWGLRVQAHRGGQKALRDYLMSRRFDLPATGTLDVVRMGDPLDVDHPFEVEVKISHPDGFHRNGTEYELPGWGLPSPFALIQKVGTSRAYPVASQARGALTYRAKVNVPTKVKPLLTERKGETPFRTLRWAATATPQGQGTQLDLSLDQVLRPAAFGFDQREKGLQAWKQDRALIKSLREDGLALKGDS